MPERSKKSNLRTSAFSTIEEVSEMFKNLTPEEWYRTRMKGDAERRARFEKIQQARREEEEQARLKEK